MGNMRPFFGDACLERAHSGALNDAHRTPVPNEPTKASSRPDTAAYRQFTNLPVPAKSNISNRTREAANSSIFNHGGKPIAVLVSLIARKTMHTGWNR
jgi:hypothetical protein